MKHLIITLVLSIFIQIICISLLDFPSYAGMIMAGLVTIAYSLDRVLEKLK